MKKGNMKIYLHSGFALCPYIEVEGDGQSDLLQLIDNYVSEGGDLPVPKYSLDEISEEEAEEYIPINGGEYYIRGIAHVEF